MHANMVSFCSAKPPCGFHLIIEQQNICKIKPSPKTTHPHSTTRHPDGATIWIRSTCARNPAGQHRWSITHTVNARKQVEVNNIHTELLHPDPASLQDIVVQGKVCTCGAHQHFILAPAKQVPPALRFVKMHTQRIEIMSRSRTLNINWR